MKPARPTSNRYPRRDAVAALLIAVACITSTTACGHADTAGGTGAAESRVDALKAPPAGSTTPALTTPTLPDAREALCRPADSGALRARLQGAINADLEWSAPAQPQCLGGARPTGAGLRLLYKGTADAQPLLLVIGVAVSGTPGTFQNVPASVTVVREGTGAFYATQGDDKCAVDQVDLEPRPGSPGRYRLSGRGYCTQPARAVGNGAGVVLVSRFDVEAVIDEPEEP
jgi:hypothetical protein